MSKINVLHEAVEVDMRTSVKSMVETQVIKSGSAYLILTLFNTQKIISKLDTKNFFNDINEKQ